MIDGKIVVLGTGGTIAGTAESAGDNIGYVAAQIGVEQLVADMGGPGDTRIVTEQVAQIDSKDMDFGVWEALARRCSHWIEQPDVAGLVVTHGTDTLEETAWFLQCVVAAAKPIVLTCAMRPATALAPDGPQNIADAIAVASAPGASGVVAVCAGVIHDARDVCKSHTYRLDAFSSGDAGPIGYVEEGGLRLVRAWPKGHMTGLPPGIAFPFESTTWPRVEIVLSHAGARGEVVDALVAQGVDGLVVAGTGNGTIHHALEDALGRAQERGVTVVRATRCADGRIIGGGAGRFEDSQGLSPVKARISLLLALLEAQA